MSGTVQALLAMAGLALGQDPGGAAEWMALGISRASAGNLEAALEPFQRACRMAPENEDACYYLGRTLFALNRHADAIGPLEKALAAAARGSRWRVHRALARNFEVLGRASDAERHFRESVRASRAAKPGDSDPRIDYGAFLFRQGRAQEALLPLEQAVAASPDSGRAHAELGRALLELGRVQESVVRLKTAVALNPKDWAAHLLLGKAYYRLGEKEAGDRQTSIGHQGLQTPAQGSSTVK